VQVFNQDRLPIQGATVRIERLGQFRITDSTGYAYFYEIPVSNWWVAAFRYDDEQIVYARDSIFVTTNVGSPTYARINLDALPFFIDVSVNAMTIQVQRLGNPIKKLHLKVYVEDPDGPVDLKRVEWRFRELFGTLAYNRDSVSAYWEAELSATDFPDTVEGIGDALNAPFYFEAFDESEKSVNTEATLIRILRQVPNLRDYEGDPPQVIHWSYDWYDDFEPGERFDYLFRVFRADPDDAVMVYDTLWQGGEMNVIDHKVGVVLEAGDYHCYVWVLDRFGNFSRSRRGNIINVPPQ